MAWPPISDGIVTIRPFQSSDRPALMAGRDREFERWMGPGSPHPTPTACVTVDGVVVGWLAFDVEHPWLGEGEANVGYHVFASYRGRGYASRGVQLLAHHLAQRTEPRTMTLLIDGQNHKSLALAERLDFIAARRRPSQPTGQRFFVRAVPPRRYRDGPITIRPVKGHDLEGAGAGCDCGPKWRFAGDRAGARHVVSVDCDLAHHDVPAGEAHISWSVHPGHPGPDHVSRAVRLALAFLRDHTAARQAHLVIDERNTASRDLAAALATREHERSVNEFGHTMIRHVLGIR